MAQQLKEFIKVYDFTEGRNRHDHFHNINYRFALEKRLIPVIEIMIKGEVQRIGYYEEVTKDNSGKKNGQKKAGENKESLV